MTEYERKLATCGQQRNNINFCSDLPSLYSDSSDVAPCFRNKIESLSDDSDIDNESNSSLSPINFDNDTEVTESKNKKKEKMIHYIEHDFKRNKEIDTPKKSKNKSKKTKKRSAECLDDTNEIKSSKKKNTKEEKPVISNNAQNMMKLMGYVQGEGLGKYGQGRVAPVSVSKQKGRRGLGLIIKDVDRNLIKYDPTKEIVSVHEEVKWLDGSFRLDFSTEELCSWMLVEKKKRTLDDETHFCEPDILQNVLICKSVFDKMSDDEMIRARSRSNPYELIKKGPFLNRAAMKMANLDCVFDYMFTIPVDEFQNSLVGNQDLLYFADVCAGPGGFSEYILSKKKWEAKGFGFTLKGDNDFKLADFYAGPCESFEPYYGDHGDGDIYKSENITSFTHYVMENTDNEGVHFMMADGGFSVKGQENLQEILSKRIYLCQCLVALSIVRNNGHFVCKLFDIFTPFSVGIIYLMYHCFRKISIHKPNTSRPANSERYIICKWKQENVNNIRDYMFYINENFNKYGEANTDEINEIVPIDIMKNDTSFYNYIVSSNNELGFRQINSLAKILEYSEDGSLIEDKQQILKKECMDVWGIPIRARRGPSIDFPDNVARNILQNNIAFLKQFSKNLCDYDINDCLYTIHDYHAVILGSNKNATFFLGIAHKKCFQYERSSGKWCQSHDIGLELSPDTLVYGEIVQELIGQTLRQRKINVFHIIDGHTLGGKNISDLPYSERIIQCALYAKSLSRPSMYNVMPIRMKEVFEVENLDSAITKLVNIIMKNSRKKLVFPFDNNQFFIPQGIMFIKATRAPYRRFISRSNNMKYYWAPKRDSVFDKDRPKESISNFRESYEESFVCFSNEEENAPFHQQSFLEKILNYISDNRYTRKNEK